MLSSQEVVDFVSARIKPDQAGKVRPLSDIVEEVRGKESPAMWSMQQLLLLPSSVTMDESIGQ